MGFIARVQKACRRCSERNPAEVKNLSLRFTRGQLAAIDGSFKPKWKVSVYQPEDVIIAATREYQCALRMADKEREKAAVKVFVANKRNLCRAS